MQFFVLQELVLRDFKTRYRNMSLGVFWSMVNPLVMTSIFYFVFTRIFTNPGIPSFPAFILCGILVYNFLSLSWSSGTLSLFTHAGLIKRVRIQRELVPISAVLSCAIHFAIQVGVLLAYLTVIGQTPKLSWLALPLVFAPLLISTVGLTLLTSALDVKFRDTQYVVESSLLVLFWLTPIFYELTRVPAEYRNLLLLNPAAVAAVSFRRILLDGTLPTLGEFGFAWGTAAVVLAIGLLVFSSLKKRFADYL